MGTQRGRIALWYWRLRCRWAGRRLAPGTPVIIGGNGAFAGVTGVIVETVEPMMMWRLVELDRPVRAGGQERRHVNAETISLKRVAS